jgi:hypothetical protein
VENIWKKCEKNFVDGKEMRKQSVGKMRKTKEWKEYEKFTRQKFGKKCGKNWR